MGWRSWFVELRDAADAKEFKRRVALANAGAAMSADAMAWLNRKPIRVGGSQYLGKASGFVALARTDGSGWVTEAPFDDGRYRFVLTEEVAGHLEQTMSGGVRLKGDVRYVSWEDGLAALEAKERGEPAPYGLPDPPDESGIDALLSGAAHGAMWWFYQNSRHTGICRPGVNTLEKSVLIVEHGNEFTSIGVGVPDLPDAVQRDVIRAALLILKPKRWALATATATEARPEFVQGRPTGEKQAEVPASMAVLAVQDGEERRLTRSGSLDWHCAFLNGEEHPGAEFPFDEEGLDRGLDRLDEAERQRLLSLPARIEEEFLGGQQRRYQYSISDFMYLARHPTTAS